VLADIRKAGLGLLGCTYLLHAEMMLEAAGNLTMVATLLSHFCCGASIAAAGRSAKSHDCLL
jgi:hypothetical protein